MTAEAIPQQHSVGLEGVSQTALIPLWARACATQTDDGTPVKAESRRVMHSLDYDFSAFEKMGSNSMKRFLALTIATRTREFDWQIRTFLSEHPRGTIVNVGAGLDDAFSRTDNGLATWYDIDIAEIIELRSSLYKSIASPRVHELRGSVLDPAVLAQIAAPSEGILFFFSGVLMYWDDRQVAQVISQLSQYFGGLPGGAQVTFDALSPLAASIADQLISAAGIKRAPIRWSLSDSRRLEQLDAHPRLLEDYPLYTKTASCPAWGKALSMMARFLDRTNGYRMNRLLLSSIPIVLE